MGAGVGKPQKTPPCEGGGWSAGLGLTRAAGNARPTRDRHPKAPLEVGFEWCACGLCLEA